MSKHLLLIVCIVVVVVGGCPQIEVPRDAVITCSAADTVCPAGYVCDTEGQRCVPDGDTRDLVVDDVDMTSPALIGVPYVEGPDGAFHATVVFSSAPEAVERAWLAGREDVVVKELTIDAGTDDKSFVLAGDLDRGLLEGRAVLFVEVVDDRRIRRRLPTDVVVDFDFTAPTPSRASIARLPDPRLSAVALDIVDPGFPAGPAVAVQVSFVVDEPVLLADDEPRLELVGSPLPLRRRLDTVSPLIFDAEWPAIDDVVGLAALSDGTFALQATVTDLAGNTATTILRVEGTGSALTDAALTIDVVSPEDPAVDVEGAVVLERAPWGRAGADGLDIHTVVGAVGSVEGAAIVRVTRDAEGLREIGRFTADTDGRFGGLGAGNELLATGDLAVVYVAAFDRAGNRSAVVEVKDVTWIASPGGKVSGDTLINPHRFETLPILATTLQQGGATELDGDDIAAEDDGVVSTEGAGSFARISTSGATLTSTDERGVIVDGAFGHDPVRGFSVIFGGRQTGPFEFSVGVAICDQRGTTDMFIRRGADPHWQRFVGDANAASPPALINARFAFDTRRNELVLIGARDATSAAELWDFDGERFSPRAIEVSCVEPQPDLTGAAIAWDLRRQLLVARDGEQTWELVDDCWQQRCAGDCGGGSGTLVYDDERAQVISFDSGSLAMSAWDGELGRWQPLCTDPACLASRPPARGGGTVAFDRQRQQLVLFGGKPDGGCSLGTVRIGEAGGPQPLPLLGDTWQFKDGLWSAGPAGPPARSRHAFGFDDTRGVVVVAAGDDCDCYSNDSHAGFTTDTWEYDGVTWQLVDPTPTPAGFKPITPLPTRDHRMTSDPLRGGIVMYGNGSASTPVGGDSIVLFKNGRYFRANEFVEGVDVAVAAANVAPVLPGLATSPTTGEIFINGGASGLAPGERAAFASVVSDNRTAFACSDGPPDCGADEYPGTEAEAFPYGHAYVHDGTRLLMFGGVRSPPANGFFTPSEDANNEFFTFTRAEGWRRACTGCTVVPSARLRTSMTITDVAGQTLLYGGAIRGAAVDRDVYLFDGTSFSRVPVPASGPVGRLDHVMVFDPERRTVMMTGGTDENLSTDDRGAAITRPFNPDLDTIWEWNDGAWSLANEADVEGDGRPIARTGSAAAVDPLVGGIVIHGGTPQTDRVFGIANQRTPLLGDSWRWRGGSDTRPAHRFATRTSIAGIGASDVLVAAELIWHGVGSDGVSVVPMELSVWSGARYEPLETASCGEGCFSAIVDGALLRQAVVGRARELVVVAAPVAFNGLAPHYAGVSTDSVELRVRYRHR